MYAEVTPEATPVSTTTRPNRNSRSFGTWSRSITIKSLWSQPSPRLHDLRLGCAVCFFRNSSVLYVVKWMSDPKSSSARGSMDGIPNSRPHGDPCYA
jgi:hypothetical protein